MAVKKKEIGFTLYQIKEIQSYADEKCEGNFNMATRQLVRIGLTKEQSNDNRANSRVK